MAEGLRLTGAVQYVRDLDRSVKFYTELLEMEVTDSSATAALLTRPDGVHLVLRATGQSGHPLGAVGVQYVVWEQPSEQALDHCEQLLRERSAFRERRTDGAVTSVEGHDPDDLVVILRYSADPAALRKLPARIYAW